MQVIYTRNKCEICNLIIRCKKSMMNQSSRLTDRHMFMYYLQIGVN